MPDDVKHIGLRLGEHDISRRAARGLAAPITLKRREPLFTFVEAMATHRGYDYTHKPVVDMAGAGPGINPNIHEYLGRLVSHGAHGLHVLALLSFLVASQTNNFPLWTTLTRARISGRVMHSGMPYYALTPLATSHQRYQIWQRRCSLSLLCHIFVGTLILSAVRSQAYHERERLMLR
jgi:hypothetical protein